jgi:hypothetical protein
MPDYRLRIPSGVPGYDFAIERHAHIMDWNLVTDAVCADDLWAKDHFARVVRRRFEPRTLITGMMIDATGPSAPWPPVEPRRIRVGECHTITDDVP